MACDQFAGRCIQSNHLFQCAICLHRHSVKMGNKGNPVKSQYTSISSFISESGEQPPKESQMLTVYVFVMLLYFVRMLVVFCK